MKTSPCQFEAMIEFMEKNGDLSKLPSDGRGRHWCLKKWEKLTKILNNDSTGDSRDVSRWRKVWSDYKSYVKKKKLRIDRSVHVTGGPPVKIIMTQLELRVLSVIGMDVPESDFKMIKSKTETPSTPVTSSPPSPVSSPPPPVSSPPPPVTPQHNPTINCAIRQYLEEVGERERERDQRFLDLQERSLWMQQETLQLQRELLSVLRDSIVGFKNCLNR